MLAQLSNLVGGLGLLLIGMSLMTENLKLAAGNVLRDILALWTNNRARGLFSGFLITGIVQSSSAVTIATIGFANAEMLSLEQAVWVIYGSNVGTSMTAWIVALLGFKVNIESLALPLVALGALLKFSGPYSKRSSVGMALVGFGLLFMGIAFLKAAFENLGANFTLPTPSELGLTTVGLYLLIGLMLTSVMQSSSAVMVITLSAAEGGLLPLNAAAALIIGANLGTTSTALISVIGATATAKRVALSHVSFNLITALVATSLLSPLLWTVGLVENTLQLSPSPALTLAIFHTIFNILGVILMWPISPFLVNLLSHRFTTREEIDSIPRHLDKNVLSLPYIAIDALALEITRINGFTVSALRNSLFANLPVKETLREPRITKKLAHEISEFAVSLGRTQLPPFLSEALAKLMEATQKYLLVVNIAGNLAILDRSQLHQSSKYFQSEWHDFATQINAHLASQNLSKPSFTRSDISSYQAVETSYSALKHSILKNASLSPT